MKILSVIDRFLDCQLLVSGFSLISLLLTLSRRHSPMAGSWTVITLLMTTFPDWRMVGRSCNMIKDIRGAGVGKKCLEEDIKQQESTVVQKSKK